MTYLGAAPTTTASRKSQVTYRYLLTAGQSVISGADLNNNTLSLDPLDTEVFMNGLKLDSTDTTITATQVSLATPGAAGDEIDVVAYRTFESADHYTKSTADTRYVNTTGGTMTGNLGVGGAANGTYAITSHSSGGANLKLENDGEVGFIRLEDDGDLNIWAHGNENISFLNGTGSGTTQMNIDASGRVTMPSQPSFRAGASSGYSVSGTTMVFNTVRHNIGNHYNATTGRFTAPVAGVYYFGYQGISGSGTTSNEQNLTMYVNNVAINDVRFRGYTSSSGHLKTVTFLAVDDYVEIKLSSSNTSTYGNAFHNQFMGFLIG